MDNLNLKSPQDRSRISLTEDWEVKWWTKTLGLSVIELKNVIAKVGNSVERVKEFIRIHNAENK